MRLFALLGKTHIYLDPRIHVPDKFFVVSHELWHNMIQEFESHRGTISQY